MCPPAALALGEGLLGLFTEVHLSCALLLPSPALPVGAHRGSPPLCALLPALCPAACCACPACPASVLCVSSCVPVCHCAVCSPRFIPYALPVCPCMPCLCAYVLTPPPLHSTVRMLTEVGLSFAALCVCACVRVLHLCVLTEVGLPVCLSQSCEISPRFVPRIRGSCLQASRFPEGRTPSLIFASREADFRSSRSSLAPGQPSSGAQR